MGPVRRRLRPRALGHPLRRPRPRRARGRDNRLPRARSPTPPPPPGGRPRPRTSPQRRPRARRRRAPVRSAARGSPRGRGQRPRTSHQRTRRGNNRRRSSRHGPSPTQPHRTPTGVVAATPAQSSPRPGDETPRPSRSTDRKLTRRRLRSPSVGIKASGGIRTARDAAAGAARGRRRPAGDELRCRRSCSNWTCMPSLDRLISSSRARSTSAGRPAALRARGGGARSRHPPVHRGGVGEEISFVLRTTPADPGFSPCEEADSRGCVCR